MFLAGTLGAMFGAGCGAVFWMSDHNVRSVFVTGAYTGLCGIIAASVLLAAGRCLDPLGFADLFHSNSTERQGASRGPQQPHGIRVALDVTRGPDLTGRWIALPRRKVGRHGPSH